MSQQNYQTEIKKAISQNPCTKSLIEVNIENLPADSYAKHYRQLGNGTAILDTAEQLNLYLAAYGDMHQEKLIQALNSLFANKNLNDKQAEVIDWGCGQAFASCVLLDYINQNKIDIDLSKFILIEPSKLALQRGLEHIEAISQRVPKPTTFAINEKADSNLLLGNNKKSSNIKIHLFSNLLDIHTLSLDKVFHNVVNNFTGENYFVCVSPINASRLDSFYKMFKTKDYISINGSSINMEIFRPSAMKRVHKSVSRIEYIFKVNL